MRENLFLSHKCNSYKCKIPVISIGNISVGGTGKTPFTIMLANGLKNSGLRVGIIGRGYKKKKKGIVNVCDGKNILYSSADSGDEMFLMAQKAMIPVVACEKKYIAAEYIENNFDLDVLLIDDGFQHLQLQREIDIILLDKESIEKPYLLPKGRLREPFTALKRANIICITDDIILNDYLNEMISDKLILRYKKQNSNPIMLFNENNSTEFNSNEKFIALCGIAKPERFINSLNEKDVRIIDSIYYQDHKVYKKNDITNIINILKLKTISNVITTEKDAVKLLEFKVDFENNNINLYVLPLEIIFDENEHKMLLNYIKDKLKF